jgi:1-deoxy-D-xylulose-5-phosphate synthase
VDILKNINSPEDIKKLDLVGLEKLASELRQFLIENVSKTGGHLASNLGIVEITLALHKVFNSPEDKIIWDVGHQSYIHKIITGRREQFDTLRKLGGISGFPKTKESCHDCFNTGHSSTAISAALGMARARDLAGKKNFVIAVVGDGALTGGMSFEALNDAGRSTNNLILILNDNEMSISKNVGGLSRYLGRVRTQPLYSKAKEDIDAILNKIPAIGKGTAKAISKFKGSIKYMIMPGVLFEELGFKYFGPIDGHNLSDLVKVLSRAKFIKGPLIIHVCTKKGKGYVHAEEKPQVFHGVSAFDAATGEIKNGKDCTFSDVFGEEIIRIAEKEKNVVGITAAMRDGTGMEAFSRKYPSRFFDVGIAEQHAVTMAAGMAAGGLIPVACIYSSFLQRSYDQIIHDIAMQNLHVILAIDRAGVVGEDGETHQGLYDISFLRHMPNMVIMAPADYKEFTGMLNFAVFYHNGPVAIRYPKGKGPAQLCSSYDMEIGKGILLREGNDVTIVSLGCMVEVSLKVCEMLKKKGISADIINPRFVKPLDTELILASVTKTGKLVTLEDNAVMGGFGSSILELLAEKNMNVETKIIGFPDKYIEHGKRSELFKTYRLDEWSLCEDIEKFLRPEQKG